jgi:hypothetical protein
MGIKITYSKFMNLSASDDYLKKINREIDIISFDSQNVVFEISSCLAAKNNSILIDFLVESGEMEIKMEMTCKVIEFECNNNVSRLNLKLIQFNKREWTEFQNLLIQKQDYTQDLLKVMRGR